MSLLSSKVESHSSWEMLPEEQEIALFPSRHLWIQHGSKQVTGLHQVIEVAIRIDSFSAGSLTQLALSTRRVLNCWCEPVNTWKTYFWRIITEFDLNTFPSLTGGRIQQRRESNTLSSKESEEPVLKWLTPDQKHSLLKKQVARVQKYIKNKTFEELEEELCLN